MATKHSARKFFEKCVESVGVKPTWDEEWGVTRAEMLSCAGKMLSCAGNSVYNPLLIRQIRPVE